MVPSAGFTMLPASRTIVVKSTESRASSASITTAYAVSCSVRNSLALDGSVQLEALELQLLSIGQPALDR